MTGKATTLKIDDLFSGNDFSGYRAGGHGRKVGFGNKPAVVVVDMINLYVSPRYALGHGENTKAVIAANACLLEVARQKRLPIFFSHVGLRPSVSR